MVLLRYSNTLLNAEAENLFLHAIHQRTAESVVESSCKFVETPVSCPVAQLAESLLMLMSNFTNWTTLFCLFVSACSLSGRSFESIDRPKPLKPELKRQLQWTTIDGLTAETPSRMFLFSVRASRSRSFRKKAFFSFFGNE